MINYKELFNLWKNERNNKELCKIPVDTFTLIEEKLNNYHSNKEKNTINNLDSILIERISYLKEDLYKIRFLKLISAVLNDETVNNDLITTGEERLLTNLNINIGNFEANCLDNDIENVSPNIKERTTVSSVEETKSPIVEIHEAQQSANDVVVRFLDDVNQFIGIDKLIYGPLTKYSIARIPFANAKAFHSKGLIQFIKNHSYIGKDKLK